MLFVLEYAPNHALFNTRCSIEKNSRIMPLCTLVEYDFEEVHQYPGRFLGINGQDPSVSKSNY